MNAPDLVATFFAFAGLDQPWKMHGRDLSPLLKDPAAAWPHPTLYEHMGHDYGADIAKILTSDPGHAVHNNVPWYVVLRERHYKYIRYLKAGEMEELYDLHVDPEELTNLALLPEHAPQLATLSRSCPRRTPPHRSRLCRASAADGADETVSSRAGLVLPSHLKKRVAG